MPQSNQSQQRVLVLGAGNFGTCLGQHLAEIGHQVTMWTVDDGVAEAINKTRKNPRFLSHVILSDRIDATNKINQKLLDSCDAMVIVIPTQAMRQVLSQMRGMIKEKLLIICAAKGIEMDTLRLPSGVVTDVLGEKIGRNASYLSGPSFAEEIVQHQPTAVAIAGQSEAHCVEAQKLFHANHFRAYRSDDPVGLCVAGALKNVIAIASGATSGIGLLNNSRAALITRGLNEITRVGVAMGANPLTFNGLAGVGDLFLTCTSEKSRNFSVGYRLGRGEKVDQVLSTTGSVAEGVYTAKAARSLSRRLSVSTPIADQVYEVIYEGKPIQEALQSLISREAGMELDLEAPRSHPS